MQKQPTKLKKPVFRKKTAAMGPDKRAIVSGKKFTKRDATSVSSGKKSAKRAPKDILKRLFREKPARLKLTEEDLINAESALGATLFGPIPKGHRREFFRFKHNTWIFHESWLENGQKNESTITYEVRENGVYKLPLGGEYVKIKGKELENFCRATAEYLKLIKTKLY